MSKYRRVGARQMSDVVRRVAGKELELDESRQVFDYTLAGDVTENKVVKRLVVAYTAPRRQATAMQKLFIQAGRSPTGLTLAPFALQNLFRLRFDNQAENSACLHIADDHSQIHIFRGGQLALTRTVKTGLDSMEEELLNMAPDTLTRETVWQLLKGLPQTSTVGASGNSSAAISHDAVLVLAALKPVLNRLIRQLERTLDYFSNQLANTPVGSSTARKTGAAAAAHPASRPGEPNHRAHAALS